MKNDHIFPIHFYSLDLILHRLLGSRIRWHCSVLLHTQLLLQQLQVVNSEASPGKNTDAKKKEVWGLSYHDFLFLYTGKLNLKAMQCYATIYCPLVDKRCI